MNQSRESVHIVVQRTAVSKGFGGSAPVPDGGPLPKMESHVTVELCSDDGKNYYARMKEDVAKLLRDQLSSHL